jgi:hypothetical protein
MRNHWALLSEADWSMEGRLKMGGGDIDVSAGDVVGHCSTGDDASSRRVAAFKSAVSSPRVEIACDGVPTPRPDFLGVPLTGVDGLEL